MQAAPYVVYYVQTTRQRNVRTVSVVEAQEIKKEIITDAGNEGTEVVVDRNPAKVGWLGTMLAGRGVAAFAGMGDTEEPP